MISNVLVANRGEIARRVFRTCRLLGLSCTAVYSDADADSPHVREADAAVRLPGVRPADTYLRADLLVDAARHSGADAVHPGYGFLSENADFAQTVEDAGLVWIGPPPEAVAAMADKIAAKRLMAAAGVPVLPRLMPADVRPADLPVIVKAAAGGGGRGMRVVRHVGELPDALASAAAEAGSAFGDPTVFCEPYLATGHHVEVQVMADRHGTVWAVGERECSIQRRHQKVLEEAPSPLVERHPGMRDALSRAAVDASAAIGYVGAGTVEFLADDDGRFFFLEMNTRLQVEHPVTEMTTGLDLVELQLRVAAGDRLAADPPTPHGSAVEARLYAEDPTHDWRPQSGVLHRFRIDQPGVRVDSAVTDGSLVSVHYDPLLAKVIAHSPTRDGAVRRLAAALAGARIHGLVTNRDLLVNVLRHPAFAAGRTDTAFFDRHGLEALAAPLGGEPAVELSARAAALAQAGASRSTLPHVPAGWRNLRSQPQRRSYDSARGRIDVEYEGAGASPVTLDVDGVQRRFEVTVHGDLVCVDSSLGPVQLRGVPRFPDPADVVAPGSLVAPMPGTVVRVAAVDGARVARGQPLVWLEAMKMEHQVVAPTDGVVSNVGVVAGQQVDVGTVLAIVSP